MKVVLIGIVLEIKLKSPGETTGNLHCGLQMLLSSKDGCSELHPRIALPANKQEAIKKMMEENKWVTKGFKEDDVAWLKQSDKTLGVTASLGIWFDSVKAAEWVVTNGVVCDQRYIGSVEAYQVKRKRCHRCQQI